MPRSTYYYVIKSVNKSDLDSELKDKITNIFNESHKRYGKYHSYKGDNGESKENLLLEKIVDEEKNKTTFQRHFETEKPNEKWVTDVSEFKHRDGKLYLSPILDLYDH